MGPRPNNRFAQFYLRNERTGEIESCQTYLPRNHILYCAAYEDWSERMIQSTTSKNNPARKTRDDLTPKAKEGVETKDINKKKNAGDLKLRFARRFRAGRDDPVEDGRDLAFAGDVLPSDRRVINGGSGGVAIGTREEKEVAELVGRGILRRGGEGEVTLDSVRGDEAGYSVRVVSKKSRGGKGKERMMVSDGDVEGVGEGGVVEGEEVMSWEEFLAEMEAEGWVPVAEDDLVSVAESWVVMQEGEEEDEGDEGDEKVY